MRSKDDVRTTLRRVIDTAKKHRDILRRFDLNAKIKSGALIPTGRPGWYEVAGNLGDLSDAIGILASELQITKTGQTRIKLGNVDRHLKSLEKLAAQKLP